MNTMEIAVVEDMLSSLAEVTIRWCRKMEDPVNSVHGDITLVADEFEQHGWRVQQKLNALRERLKVAAEVADETTRSDFRAEICAMLEAEIAKPSRERGAFTVNGLSSALRLIHNISLGPSDEDQS